ncbi:hypothetical protein BH20VER3_BH20VER3_02490 [soil metagenome]
MPIFRQTAEGIEAIDDLIESLREDSERVAFPNAEFKHHSLLIPALLAGPVQKLAAGFEDNRLVHFRKNIVSRRRDRLTLHLQRDVARRTEPRAMGELGDERIKQAADGVFDSFVQSHSEG